MTDYLLDTNAAIALLNDDATILPLIQRATGIYIPVIVMGELFFGAENSGRTQKNLDKAEELATKYPILDCTLATARYYGRVRYALKKTGKTKPVNDIWIGAIALQHNLTLITRDSDFQAVDGLIVLRW